MAASNQPSSSTSAPAQEYIVRVPRNVNKKYSIMKFNPASNVDFTKCGSAKLERENNLKEFNLSHDIGLVPKFGAGSEFGREQKDEARRKKYGVMVKKYNPENQPWNLTLGQGKQAKRFRGTKEGSILENASYYIFTQCADGAFEAFPLEEWNNFTPVMKYKYLNAEEAEEEFSRRDKTLNLFSVMVRKRLKNDDTEDDPEEKEEKKKGKGKKKDKSLLLTDMDDWMDSSEDDESDADGSDDDDKPRKKKVKAKQKTKSSGKKKKGTDDEAEEDSDSVDEGAEVDYMTDSDSNDEDMYNDLARETSDKYEDKGVVDEDGLRKIINSDEEEEEEEKNEEEEEEEDRDEKEKTKKEELGSDSSGDSGSDSDVEKETTFSSALFMPQKKSKKPGSKEGTPNNSRSPTPTVPGHDKKDTALTGTKRKQGEAEKGVPAAKKTKADTSSGTPSPVPTGSEGVTEEAVRRYLMRKPMTIKDLLQKLHKNTGLGKEKLVTSIAQILKKINPEKVKRDSKLYLHIKK